MNNSLIRILIVDDNDDARNYHQRILAIEDDIEVVGQSTNGQEALDAVGELHPHVVLMDMNMPVMDGITACGLIRKQYPAVQVVIISVQDDAGPMRAAIENGAAAFLIKPVSPDDLTDLIHRAYNAYMKLAPAA
jgi:DNA-binding NarL/FixJ family response regulator